MPRIWSIGQIDNSKNKHISYVAKSTAASAGLGAAVQGVYDLGYYVKNHKELAGKNYLKTIPNTIASSALYSALLGFALSATFLLVDKIKNNKKPQNQINQN